MQPNYPMQHSYGHQVGPHFERPHNGQWTVALIWFGIGLAGLMAAFAPAVIEMDMMNGGYALIMLGLFVTMFGLIGGIMYANRARTLDRIFSGDRVLVWWRYAPDEWRKFAVTEFQIAKSEKVPLYILTVVISLIIGGIFFIADPKAGGIVFLGLMGLMAFIGLLVLVLPRLRYAKNQETIGETIISMDGVYINGDFHSWNFFSASVDSVRVLDADPLLLEFTYSFVTRTGRQEENVRVPIPRGQEAVAGRVVEFFTHQA